ncbi:isocitrate lyase/phosphoenolpyruvate mutase family protein [Saccharopolyspora sp. NFXS83]|uniref:isocitrate lyase/PEP mutase family protein n=1 Tax=Saccharopolyspora sp. NFXS83 TaxID=2993560 RepID=UPI00224ADC7D|nr:isocitrate lyase/phosphoenolpyruvate mutase family protein [Saccharopolyspora sp. NFXS83]MCX2734275.1 isocitrate lyase/phosphoenolpyruvate mutase family protein [Saccharopolyspora sp. NFXS83]
MEITSVERQRRGSAFAELHEGPGAFVVPNPWDAGTARLLAGLGFRALATTSGGLAHRLGRRDGARRVDRDETLHNVREVVAATELPVSADLENGFGDAPEDAADAVRAVALAGAVGGSIEDATGRDDDPIYGFDHAVQRIAAASEAARELPFPFTLTARAENFLHGRADLDDTIRRLRAFEQAGADVLYAPALPDAAAIRAVCAAVTKPVNVLAVGAARELSVPGLAELGVRRVSLGSTLSRAALSAVVHSARQIAEHGTLPDQAGVLSGAEIDAVLGNT